MIIGGNEKLALIPFILCLLLWLVPSSDNSESVAMLKSDPSTAVASNVEEVVSQKLWQPGAELILVGFLASVAIYGLLKVQGRLQARAAQSW